MALDGAIIFHPVNHLCCRMAGERLRLLITVEVNIVNVGWKGQRRLGGCPHLGTVPTSAVFPAFSSSHTTLALLMVMDTGQTRALCRYLAAGGHEAHLDVNSQFPAQITP